jgi:hypothetical protein
MSHPLVTRPGTGRGDEWHALEGEQSMKRSVWGLMLALAVVAVAGRPAYAQGGATSTLSGVVVDADGGVVPGATVSVKNNATAVTLNTVTNTSGSFSVPALDAGTYTVTISLQGFKTTVLKDVALQAATPASVKVKLEIGGLSETIEVKAGTDLIQTQSAQVSTTLNVDQLAKLPAPSRNALNFVTMLPGVDTPGANRNSTVMGLPQSTLSITIDGVNVQDNYLKSTDGFFARVTPRQDAVEQVTVSTATPGADAAGQGAVQIQFVTRSGTNQFKGTAYHYYRDSWLNTNYWFNARNSLPRNEVTLNQFGASEGGPLVSPGVYDGRGKAFFFFNHEEFIQPTTPTRTRTVMRPGAETGLFRYGGSNAINVMTVAANTGNTATFDPQVVQLLNTINAATQTTGVIRDDGAANTLSYLFQSINHQYEHQPTVSLDYNLSARHRLKGTYNWEVVVRDPDFLNNADARFPGFVNQRYYASYRPSGSVNLRSTMSANLVNELRVGGAWGPSYFGLGPGSKYESPSHFDNQGGFSLNLGFGLTSATTETAPSARLGNNWNVDEKLNWLRGKHNFTFGGSFTQVNSIVENQTLVPTITFGVDTNDPANAMFTTANFPGASNTDLNNARSLYALLTGRVTQISGNVRVDEATGQYVFLGKGVQRGRMNEFGFFAQDSWRLTPTLTLSGGARWELQLPFQALNSVYATSTLEDACGMSGLGNGPGGRGCNMFNPNASGGKSPPQYVQFNSGNPGYKTDYNNVAPNVGVAWRPNVQGGWLRTILGDPEQATLRGGYSIAFNRNGMEEFMSVYAANPGLAITTNRNVANGNLIPAGQTFPLLLRDRDLLGPPAPCGPTPVLGCVPTSPTFPTNVTSATSINIFDPGFQIAYSRSYTAGFQRSLDRDTAVEVRYVGTRNVDGLTEENWNERILFENGFVEDFRRAQANLQASIAAGCGGTGQPACSFAFRGPGTGTSPLPIYLAYFNGVNGSQADNAALYTGTNWTNTTFVGRLGARNPDVSGSAGDLDGNAGRRANALAAGLPANFFVLNPQASSVNVSRGESFTRYDSLQIELRRRFARGFQVSGNYTYAVRSGSTFDSLRLPRYLLTTASVPHAYKWNWNYEVPVGRGKRFGSNMSTWMDTLIGGWQFDGTGRVQRRNLAMSGVRLVGMTVDELQDMYKVEIRNNAAGLPTPFMLPDDVILNTRRAFNTSATSTTGYSSLGVPEGRYIERAATPGCLNIYPTDCGEPRQIFLNGPWFARVDMSFKKTIPLKGRVNAVVQFDLLNAFNAINFNPVLNPGTGETIFQVTSAYQDTNNTFDPGGRLGQIVWRINW